MDRSIEIPITADSFEYIAVNTTYLEDDNGDILAIKITGFVEEFNREFILGLFKGESTYWSESSANEEVAPVYLINDLKLNYEFECADIEYEKYSVIWNTIEGYMLEKLTMVMDVEIAEGTI